MDNDLSPLATATAEAQPTSARERRLRARQIGKTSLLMQVDGVGAAEAQAAQAEGRALRSPYGGGLIYERGIGAAGEKGTT